jgi:hypothetical protein
VALWAVGVQIPPPTRQPPAGPPAQRVRLDGGAVGFGADPALIDVGRTEGEPLLGTLSFPAPEQGTHLLAHDDGPLSAPFGGRPDVKTSRHAGGV